MSQTPTQDLILSAIRDNGPMTVDEIANAIGKGTYNVRDRIRWMVVEGKLTRIARGLYANPTQAEEFNNLKGMG